MTINITKLIANITNIFGFDSSVDRGIDPIKNIKNTSFEDMSNASILSNYLLYEYFNNDNSIFFNNNSLGFMLEIGGVIGSDISIEKNLSVFLNNEIPKDGFMQFLLIASNDISRNLDIWEKSRCYGGKVIKKLTKYRKEFVKNKTWDVESSKDGVLARNYKVFINYSQRGVNASDIDKAINFKNKLLTKLSAESISARVCNEMDLVYLVKSILEVKTKSSDFIKTNLEIDKINSLSNQILDVGLENLVSRKSINHKNIECSSRAFYPKTFPKYFSLSDMICLLGDGHRTIPGKFFISYTITNNLGSSGTSSLLNQGNRVIHASSKSYTKNDITIQEEARDWLNVKAMNKKGEVFLSESMLVVISAPNKHIDYAEEVLKSLYSSYDWKLELCEHVQRLAVLSILPMTQCEYWDCLKFFKMTRYVLSGDVVAKLPIHLEYKGAPISGVLLMGRRGQVFNFNPFCRIEGGGNYNICLMAPSGAGKSFFLQELTQSMISQNIAVFIMDIGGSYKNLSDVLSEEDNSEMIRLNNLANLSLNPFANISTSGARFYKIKQLLQEGRSLDEIVRITGSSFEEIESVKHSQSNIKNDGSEIEIMEIWSYNRKEKYFVVKDGIVYAKSMIIAMSGMKNDNVIEAIIEKSIIKGISKYGSLLDVTKLSLILKEMKEKDGIESADKIADSLYPYTENGIHGKFFKSGTNVNFQKMLTVFELEELVNDKPLLGVILQIILMQITMQFLCGNRSKKFMLIVDEAWMILDYAASFLERFARTVRKYGGSLVVCTQDLGSFSNNCGNRKSQAAALESSSWKLILQQKEEGIQTFIKSKAYDKYIGLIESIRKTNKFSEILINTDGATVVGRLAVDPYSMAMFSTEAEDFKFLQEMDDLGLSKDDAIERLSLKYKK